MAAKQGRQERDMDPAVVPEGCQPLASDHLLLAMNAICRCQAGQESDYRLNIAGKVDLVYAVTIPLLKDIKDQAPQAICEEVNAANPRNLIVNRDKPPFNRSFPLRDFFKALIRTILTSRMAVRVAMYWVHPTYCYLLRKKIP